MGSMDRPDNVEDLKIVRDRAPDFSLGYIAQIIQVTTDLQSGDLAGTGNVLRTERGVFLLTAGHVPAQKKEGPLAYSIGHGDHPVVIDNPWYYFGEPSDIAVVRIDPPPNTLRRWVTPEMLASASSADASRGLYHLHGFPGAQSRFTALGNGIHSTTLPYTTYNGSLPAGYNPRFHMAVEYSNDDQLRGDDQMVSLPNPGGLSGSIIWRSNYTANRATWTPDMMSIAGIAIEWDHLNARIIGTRVEVVAEVVRRIMANIQ